MEHFPQAYATPPQLMPAAALVKLDTVTNELLELAKASRANKVRINTLAFAHQWPAAIEAALTCHAWMLGSCWLSTHTLASRLCKTYRMLSGSAAPARQP